MRYFLFPMLAVLFAISAIPADAAKPRAFPAGIMKISGVPLEQVGAGKYRKLGMDIYGASLWAPGSAYDKDQPYALRIRYARSLSKETVVAAVVDDVRAQNMADAETMDKWQALLTRTLPAVKNGDEIIGLSLPGKPTTLFLNGRQIASIADKRLSDSFFNIWLGDIANQDLRGQLLNI